MSIQRRERAAEPEDITRLFVERANAGDADGLAELYEPDAVLGFPPGRTTVGRDAIRAVLEEMLAHVEHFEPEEPLPTLRSGDLVRREADGTWLRALDMPEIGASADA